MTPSALLGQLREFVGLLAAPAEEQASWLQQRDFPVDELLQQYDDAVPAWLPRLSEAGLLTDQAAAALLLLRSVLLDLPEVPDLWTPDGLRAAARWQEVRDAARRTLSELDA